MFYTCKRIGSKTDMSDNYLENCKKSFVFVQNIYGRDNHCSKCWSTKDFYQQNNGSVDDAFLRDICAFLKINKADLR